MLGREPRPGARVAWTVKRSGATLLRGGAFKARSDPRSFQGPGRPALHILLEAKVQTGLGIVTELLDVRDLEAVLRIADVVQVGARNMQNTPMLKELGEIDRPVLLKRGFAATIDEAVSAADYLRSAGNARVIHCERGIRTFETAYRFTLDVAAIPILKERSGLPVIVDPSHAAGRRDLVACLAKAAVAAGADGLIVEVDEHPELALSDARQQLRCADFAAFMADVEPLVAIAGRRISRA